MDSKRLNLVILPLALGLLIVGGAASWWLYEMWSLSVGRGEGKYATVLPPIVVPKPAK